jgi:UDP-N-acetylmuramoyl-tripeptide--D-alanyl-D-alanine ligase
MPVICRSVRFGFINKKVDFHGEIVALNDTGCALLSVNSQINIQLSIPGRVAAQNALAAVAVGLYYGVGETTIIAALEQFQAVSQRFVQMQVGSYQIINDAYNANPNSTIAALETFRGIKTTGRKIFVMGDMLELGDLSAAGHAKVGQAVAMSEVDRFYGVGRMTARAISAALEAGMSAAFHYQDKAALLEGLKKDLYNGDTLLIKGSRGSHMEEIIEGLRSCMFYHLFFPLKKYFSGFTCFNTSPSGLLWQLSQPC